MSDPVAPQANAVGRSRLGRPAYEAVVVGTGFGGAVAACRLAQAGVAVAVLERGRRYPPGSFPRSRTGADLLWRNGTGQIGWLAVLAVPPGWYVAVWVALALGELVVPIWGEGAPAPRCS